MSTWLNRGASGGLAGARRHKENQPTANSPNRLTHRNPDAPHQAHNPELEVSTFHLAQQIKSGYEGLSIAVPPDHWSGVSEENDPRGFLQRLLCLARRIRPKQVATSKRGPKIDKAKGYVDGKTARSHVSTDRVLKGLVTP